MSDSQEPSELRTLVREKIDAWHAGQEPDASQLLTEFPALRQAKSLVLDLALAEYEVRTASGDEISKSEFCDRFPNYRQSIAKLLEVHEFLDQCPQYAVDDKTRWPAPGDEFLGFEVVEPLGRGGMARVFLARQPELGGRQVVIKVSRFASREAHTLGKLSHPSIMPVFSVTADDDAGWTVICMPLLGAATGVDLLDAAFEKGAVRDPALIQRVARETRPLEASIATISEEFDWHLTYLQAVARIGLQLAEALATAHAVGILHRDIKPSNVLLAWSGRPILLDFNLSSDAAAMVHGVGGTLAYMAPELISSVLTDKGQAARQFDPRYDIYSLGVVLYELLTGQLPAKPANAERLPLDAYEPWLECKRQAPAAMFLEADSAVSDDELQKIVGKCLSFDPAERFATASDLAAALRAFFEASTRPVASDQAPVHLPQPTQSAVRHRRRDVLVAGLSLMGAGFGVAVYYGTRRTPLEVLYQQAIDEYNDKKYVNAVATFTKCLEQKPGWPDALFGRGQSFRKLEKWREARTDFVALRDANALWANTLVGYCSMRLNEDFTALLEFQSAYRLGQRTTSFLLNFARVQTRRQRYSEAAKYYTDVLEQNPHNTTALRNRVLTGVALVRNEKDKVLAPSFLNDAKEYLRLEPESFEAAMCAAIAFGEAARKEAAYHKEAVDYLTRAIQNGLPVEAISTYSLQLRPLLGDVNEAVLRSGKHDSSYRVNFAPIEEFSDAPIWEEFVRPAGPRVANVTNRHSSPP